MNKQLPLLIIALISFGCSQPEFKHQDVYVFYEPSPQGERVEYLKHLTSIRQTVFDMPLSDDSKITFHPLTDSMSSLNMNKDQSFKGNLDDMEAELLNSDTKKPAMLRLENAFNEDKYESENTDKNMLLYFRLLASVLQDRAEQQSNHKLTVIFLSDMVHAFGNIDFGACQTNRNVSFTLFTGTQEQRTELVDHYKLHSEYLNSIKFVYITLGLQNIGLAQNGCNDEQQLEFSRTLKRFYQDLTPGIDIQWNDEKSLPVGLLESL